VTQTEGTQSAILIVQYSYYLNLFAPLSSEYFERGLRALNNGSAYRAVTLLKSVKQISYRISSVEDRQLTCAVCIGVVGAYRPSVTQTSGTAI
jgi:hypothetical protein